MTVTCMNLRNLGPAKPRLRDGGISEDQRNFPALDEGLSPGKASLVPFRGTGSSVGSTIKAAFHPLLLLL